MEQQNKYKYFDNEIDGLHLHTLGMVPLYGTSTITKIISKSQPFMWWAVQMALAPLGFMPPRHKEGTKYVANDKELRLQEAKQGLERIKVCTPQEYLDMLDKAYVAHNVKKEESAEEGTKIHKELERFIGFCMTVGIPTPDTEDAKNFDARLNPFIEWTYRNVKRFLWKELHMYSEVLWTGGISDLGYEKYDETVGIFDLKSAKDAYTDMFIQIAGYDFQVTENGGFDAEGNKIFDLNGKKITEYAILPLGMYTPVVLYRKDVEALQEGFKACLVLHKLMNVN